MSTIAFIGLGNMGGPMAANLVRAGHNVTGFDPSPDAARIAKEHGIALADSATSAVQGAEVIITMLPNGRLVLSVYEEVLASIATGSLLIDCSTIAVDDARSAAELASRAGHRAIDAPVSGGVGGAAAGTLTFMVGAADSDFAAAQSILNPMAGKVVHCGGNGAGQAAKICNNMVLGITMIGISEAFVLGERLGLTHQALFDVASTASGQCWALTTNCPVPGPVPTSPSNRDYQPGFATPLMSKDLDLAMQAANSSGTSTQIGQLAADVYRTFAEQAPGVDFSAVINSIRDASGETA